MMAPISFLKDTKPNYMMSPAISSVDTNSCCVKSSISQVDRQSHTIMPNANSAEEVNPDGIISNGSSQENRSSDCQMPTANVLKNIKSDCLMSYASSQEDTKLDCLMSLIPPVKCSEVTHNACFVSSKRCSEERQSTNSKETHSAYLVSCPVVKPSISLLSHKCPEENQSVSKLDCKSLAEREIVRSNELPLLQLEEVKAHKRIPSRLMRGGSASRLRRVYEKLLLRKGGGAAASIVENSDGSLSIVMNT